MGVVVNLDLVVLRSKEPAVASETIIREAMDVARRISQLNRDVVLPIRGCRRLNSWMTRKQPRNHHRVLVVSSSQMLRDHESLRQLQLLLVRIRRPW